MTLSEKQRLFTRLVGELYKFAYKSGFELTFGEVKRKVSEAAENETTGIGIKNSLHILSLAVDFNLFKEGRFCTFSEEHKPLGEFWKGLHPLCRWGGDFKPKSDGNHYSLEHEGVK